MKSLVTRSSAAALLIASIALAQGADTPPEQDVVRVVMPPERVAEFRQHTRDLLAQFDTRNPTVDLDKIFSPGATRDPLPALTNPARTPAAGATFPPGEEPVTVVTLDGETVAYPRSVLTYHGVVNDEIAGVPVAVWHDPISGSTAVFKRRVRGEVREFRLAGLLLHGAAALYDARTMSLVSPLDGGAVTGPLSGTRFEFVPFRVMTFGDYRDAYKNGETLAKPRGTPFDYSINPFADFHADRNTVFTQATDDTRLHPRTAGLGIEAEGSAMFVPFGSMTVETKTYLTPAGFVEASLTADGTLLLRSVPEGVTAVQTWYQHWFAAHPKSGIAIPFELKDLPAGVTPPPAPPAPPTPPTPLR